MEFSKKAKDPQTGMYKNDMLKAEDRWILNKLDKIIETVTRNINEYDLGIAIDNIYKFIWDDFCDWYIEMVKPRLYSDNKQEKIQVSFVLNYVFGDAMKLLHPFMPFVTSEIYSHLSNYNDKDLMMTSWPALKKRVDYDESADFIEEIKNIIVGVRNVRANMDIHPSKKAELIFVTNKYQNELKESENFILKLAFGTALKIKENKEGIPENAISVLSNEIELYMPFEELVDIGEERKRLEKEKEKLEAEIKRSNGILSNQGFLAKAPQEKIEEEKAKLEKYTKMLEDINGRLS